jgi:hypothetical protein
MTPPKRTVTGFVAIVDGVRHPARQIGPVFETEDEPRGWAKHAIKADPDLKGTRVAISRATINFEQIGIPV